MGRAGFRPYKELRVLNEIWMIVLGTVIITVFLVLLALFQRRRIV
jgi:hypothetical protein